MQATIISDASCLILLDKIEELHLLQKLFGMVVTTQTVAAEFGGTLPDWIHLQDPMDQNNVKVLQTSLDKGEASAIALAMEKDTCLLIIDELKGRKLARQLGLQITGTLGLLAEAKKRGHVSSVRPLLDKIKRTNFRISEELEATILRYAGE